MIVGRNVPVTGDRISGANPTKSLTKRPEYNLFSTPESSVSPPFMKSSTREAAGAASMRRASKGDFENHPNSPHESKHAEVGSPVHIPERRARALPTYDLPIIAKPSAWKRTKNFFSKTFFTKTGFVGTGAVVAGSLALAGIYTIPFVGQTALIATIVVGGVFLLRRLYKWATIPLFHSTENSFSHIIQNFNRTLPTIQAITEADSRVLGGIVSKLQRHSLVVNKPILIKKSEHHCQHSFLLYKNKIGNICIIIKPNIKNRNSKDYGTYKIIKRSGIKIEFYSNLTEYSCQKVVTCSKSRPADDGGGNNKNLRLKQELDSD